MKDMLQTPIESIKGVGKSRLAQMNRLKVYTVGDLLKHIPRAYRDLTRLSVIDEMRDGQPWFGLLTITGDPKLQYIRRNFSVVRVPAEDDTGGIMLVYYNMPYMKQNMVQGERYYIYGAPSFDRGELRLVNPMTDREDVGEGERLLPVYRATAGLTQRMLRKIIRQAMDDYGVYLQDGLPRGLRERHKLLPTLDAYEMIHFPPDYENKEDGIKSLATEELLSLKLFLQNNREAASGGGAIEISEADEQAFFNQLDFTLTDAQKKVMREIKEDLRTGAPMRRLVQGDVGCGKTIVAFYGMYSAVRSGGQAAMLAPTEILAEQHFKNAVDFFGKLGFKVGLLKAGMKKSEQADALEAFAGGDYDIVVGTHSLLSERVKFKRLALVVADEQHRFGVEQRAKITAKGESPHMVIMSATPIPRTLALIIYGDLDISVIDELPAGRKPVETRLVGDHKRRDMFGYIAAQVARGSQAYVVCPLIEEGDMGRKSVQQVYKDVCAAMPGVNVALLHGKLKQKEKDEVIKGFAQNEMSVLVSTTVIEVGVDVPNATIMVIEEAESFGLAQLHQLRGRVGRGAKQSWCFLSTDDASNPRLQALCATNDGFAIAQADMEQRGPGELLGTEQHGSPGLWVTRLLTDSSLLKQVEDIYTEIEAPGHEDEKAYIVEKAKQKFVQLLQTIAMN